MQHSNAANDEFYHYFLDILISQGTLALAEQFKCFWFIDIIVSYQYKLKEQEFQVWRLVREPQDMSATVFCTDGNDNIIISQSIPFSDFEATEATLWVEGKVILLPSEH